MDARSVPTAPHTASRRTPLPVVLFLGSGRIANGLCLALASEAYHTILAQSWSHVRALSGFLRPDLIVLAPDRAEELAWRGCFDPGIPELSIATLPTMGGLVWPLAWSEFLAQVGRQMTVREPALTR